MKNLCEVYKDKNKLGKIELTKDGIIIDGKLIKTCDVNSIRLKRIGIKTIVNCDFYCDSFESIP